MVIRKATRQDLSQIRDLHLAAFYASENETVARLAVELLDDSSSPPTLSLVAESDDAVVGHVAFSPVGLAGDASFNGFLLGPLGVLPAFQGRGIGAQLVREGMQALSDADVLLVYGDPNYYGRFGFSAEAAAGLTAPYPLQFDFGWLALHRKPGSADLPRGAITCVDPLNDPALW